MTWKLSGQMVETCSCNMLCPCWYGVQDLMVMDEGWCGGPMLVRLAAGEVDGVDVSGRNVVLAIYFPGPTLLDGNGTARLYLDDQTTPEQAAKLEEIFSGARGGPMEVLASLVSTRLPTKQTAIHVSEQNGSISATAPEFGVVQSELLKNEAGDTMTMSKAGFVVAFNMEDQTAELAPSAGTRWSDPDLPREFASKSGARGRFTWNGE